MATSRTHRILSGPAPFATAILVFTAAASRAQTIVRSFDGDSGTPLAACQPDTTWCGRQPEINVAANGKQVVQTTWQNVNVYDYSGKLLRSTPLATFIRHAGLDPMPPSEKGPSRGPFEPHVVFNEFIDRWILTATAHSDALLVSASPDALGAWGGVHLSCLEDGPCLNRDPGVKLGYDKNGVYYCGGHIGDDNPQTIQGVGYDCLAVPSAEVKAVAQGTPPAHISRAHNMPLDVTPAIDNDPNKATGAPAFFMNKSCDHVPGGACQRSDNFPFQWIVNTFTWNGPTGIWNAGGAQQVIKTDVGSTANKWVYNTPCCGTNFSIPQAGTDVTLRAAASHRVMNVVQAGAHLYGVLGSGPCTKDCGAQGTDTNNLMFYVDLDCSRPAACVVSQTAKIAGSAFNPEFGTVGVDAQGNVGIVAASSTAATHLGLLLWTRKKTDPPGTFSGPTTVVAGTQPYTCLPDRKMEPMGNAVGILTARDPLDGTKLWTTQQWANDARPCVFSTRIVEYQIVPGTPGPAKQPGRRR